MHNNKNFKGKKEIRIYTPDYVSDKIKYIVNSYNIKPKHVLDICSGDLSLSLPYNCKITAIDLELPQDKDLILKDNVNFIKGDAFDFDLSYIKKNPIDLIVCNPPFSGHPSRKLYPELFLNDIISKYPNTPLVLITPISLLSNQRLKSKRYKDIRDNKNININKILKLPIDVFYDTLNNKQILLHTEVLFINFNDNNMIEFL